MLQQKVVMMTSQGIVTKTAVMEMNDGLLVIQ